MAKSIYRRLTGRRRGFTGYTQLWLAPDHILLVDSNRFTEHYRRFALADIQAIVITGLPDRTIWQIAALAAALAWTLALFLVDTRLEKYSLGITGGIGIVIALADIARGLRCRCHLHTAVSRELLAPVSRVRVARTFLDRIRPAIEAVQGTLAPERIAELPMPAAQPIDDAPPEVPAPPGYVPEALFGLFLIDALLVLLAHRFPRTNLSSALLTTFFGEFIIMVVAFIRRAGRDPRRAIYALMVIALGFLAWDSFNLVSSFGGFMGSIMEAARKGAAQPPALTNWAPFSSMNVLLSSGWRIAAGAIGLALAWWERRELKS
jgi:hypothetical protein